MPAPAPPAADRTPLETALGERMVDIGPISVSVEARQDDEAWYGTGVVVADDGTIATAAHVVGHLGATFRVTFADGTAQDASVLRRDQRHDVALLHTRPHASRVATLASPGAAAGQWVVCAGYGGGLDQPPMRTVGVVLQTWFTWARPVARSRFAFELPAETTQTFEGMLETDCTTAPGMSGGPVLDKAGHLVGLVTASNGVAAPAWAIARLLSPSRHVSATAAARATDGSATRDAALQKLLASPELARAERSVVRLIAPDRSPFPGVVVAPDLVIAPAVRLASEESDAGRTIEARVVHVVDQPDARCEDILAVRGELALLRVSHLDAEPIGGGAQAALGEAVAVLEAGQRSVGFVTGLARSPGLVAPEARPIPGACGTSQMHRRDVFRRAFPPVTVASAMTDDADGRSYGSLVVDGHGRPVALHVAAAAPGLDYAVPWATALARFPEWLARANGASPL